MKPRGGRTADRPAGHDALAGHNRLDLLPREKVYRGFVDITLLYFNDCPNWGQAAKNLDVLAAEFPDLNVTRRLVDTDAEALRVGFHGSPSILIEGVEVFAPKDVPVGLSCRMYQTPDGPAGSPTIQQLRDAVTARRRSV